MPPSPFVVFTTSISLIVIVALMLTTPTSTSAQVPNELGMQNTKQRNNNKEYHQQRKIVDEADKRRNEKEGDNNNARGWSNFDNGVETAADLEVGGAGAGGAIKLPPNLKLSGENEEEAMKRDHAEKEASRPVDAAIPGNARKGAEGLDGKLVAAFQQPQQKLNPEQLSFYTPIEVAMYKDRVQCAVCRAALAVLDDRQTQKFERPRGYYDDVSFRTASDLLERIEFEGCSTIEWGDEDLLRLCKNSANVYDGLCMKDLMGACEAIRKHLIHDRPLPRGNHRRASSHNVCMEVGMCKRMR